MALSVDPNVINYAVAEYESFEVREVFLGSQPKHEYHIRIKDGSSTQGALVYLRTKFDGCEIGLVDPSGILNLEYPIYVIVKSELIKDIVKSIFDEIDEELRKHSRKDI